MFFKESDILVGRHPELTQLIESIDRRLSEFDAEGVARASDFANFLSENPNQVSAIFERYVSEGLLRTDDVVECARCQTLHSAQQYRARLAAEDSLECGSCGDDLVEQSPRQYYVHRLTDSGLKRVSQLKARPSQEITHIVLLIHGIRTPAVWQEFVASELNALPSIRAIPLGFEYLDVLRFWLPGPTRSGAVRKVLKKIRHAIALYPRAEVSVIAHSFGTYAIFRILQQEPDLRFKRIVLCGSIVSHDAPWDHLQPRIGEEIINECGTKDVWPVAARALSWGYGATGTFGFKTPGIQDRFHELDHGGFFSEEFVRTYWIPSIAKGKIMPSRWSTQRPSSLWWLCFGSSTLFRWILGLLMIGAAVIAAIIIRRWIA